MQLTKEQLDEIAMQRTTNRLTHRAVSQGIEDRLYEAIPVLDNGFVRAIDYMGNDEAIVQAARVSYGTGTKEVSNDRGLIRYLMRHWHSTPFEMCEIKLHVKLPVFVARQWIRHRTANVNEYSARYSILDREFYIPPIDRMAVQSKDNKQGSGDLLPPNLSEEVQQMFQDNATKSYGQYERMIGDPEKLYWNDDFELTPGYGLARELARINLPASIYTQWYWKTDLHNLFHFLKLRADPHAQFEIRCYAQAIADIVKDWVPLAYEAFLDYRQNAVNFSAQEMSYLRELLNLDPSQLQADQAQNTHGLSAREFKDFTDKMRPKD